MRMSRPVSTYFVSAYIRALRFLLGINKKTVVFESFYGNAYSDNPKAISEALIKESDAEIAWVFNDASKAENVPGNVRIINRKSKMQYYRELATCGVFVSNFSMPRIPKGKKQFFIQTWHGDRAFKKILYDNPYVPKDFYAAESEKGYCDLCIAGSDYGERKFRSAFHYAGEISKQGTPRNDRLVNQDPYEIERLKREMHVPNGTRILLYAPTIRKKNKNLQEIKNIDLNRTLTALEKKYACNWVCFVRAHPSVAELSGIAYGEHIWNMSEYEDMADLLLVSDMLITDYSSCAGDFALLKRPLILFHADILEYMEEERTFYFDVRKSPYYIAENQETLESLISKINDQDAKENCEQILEFYGSCETGCAAQYIAKIISEKVSDNK